MKKTFLFLCAMFLLFGFVAFAEDEVTPLDTTDFTCIENALEKRDGTILTAMETYHKSWIAAFTLRTSSFLDAFDKPTKKEIKSSMSMTWKVYRTAIFKAKRAKGITIQKAWNTYRADLKLCKGDVVGQLREERGTSDLFE